MLTFNFCCLIYGNYYLGPAKLIAGQPNQILAGPIGQPRKKLSLTPGEDADPGFNYGDRPTPTIDNSTPAPQKDDSTTQPSSDETNQQTVPEYGRHNPRRSGRNMKPRHPCNMNC